MLYRNLLIALAVCAGWYLFVYPLLKLLAAFGWYMIAVVAALLSHLLK